MVPEAARDHYFASAQIIQDTGVLLERVWDKVDFTDLSGSWDNVADLALVSVAAGQEAAAGLADGYVSALGFDREGSVVPAAFSGAASDGSDLDSLLYMSVISTKEAIAEGANRSASLATGLHTLLRVGATQVGNAGRGADGVAMAASPRVTHWVRMLQLPSCGRCAVLAGKRFTWKADFARHPFCDCIAVPSIEFVADEIRINPDAAVRAGQVNGLSKEDTKAIVEDGADASQVINAHAGMYTAGGRKLTRQGSPRRLQGEDRMRPEQIYREAATRAEAIALLQKHGYLI